MAATANVKLTASELADLTAALNQEAVRVSAPIWNQDTSTFVDGYQSTREFVHYNRLNALWSKAYKARLRAEAADRRAAAKAER